LDDYDPFGSNQTTTTQPPTLQTSNQTTTTTLPAYSSSGQQYQVNEPNGAGAGVTQISTAELQVSHQYFVVVFVRVCNGISVFHRHRHHHYQFLNMKSLFSFFFIKYTLYFPYALP
jgi:hypothetical protein